MVKMDGRRLNRKTLEEIRFRAVAQVQSGESPEVVIKALGMSRTRIYEWLAAYRAGGWDALRAKKTRGRPTKLTGRQIRWIFWTVVQGDPRQFRLEFALWTLGLIKELIRKKYGMRLGTTSVWRLLRQLGLTCQRPLFKAYQQNREAVAEWLKKTFPRIQALARKAGARIFFGDEAGIRSDAHAGTTWALKGETPTVPATGKRFGLNMISAISRHGEMRFMIVDGTVKAPVFIEFLRRLIDRVPYRVFLILDGLKVHRSKAVKRFVTSTGGRLALFYLPGYSPELNPDEFVWNELKSDLGRMFVMDKTELHRLVTGRLRRLQRNRQKIQSFFHGRHTLYAA